ncbi:MAG: gliding motility-associated C-terminal domain-containing protein [Bacteroidetes bacterium]|nr:gliding motility-associated C-terminal domain-containing protein [Bacteroidota bacterium]
MPNSFTPNGIQKNDSFSITADPAIRLEKFEMKIYNRWGEMVL